MTTKITMKSFNISMDGNNGRVHTHSFACSFIVIRQQVFYISVSSRMMLVISVLFSASPPNESLYLCAASQVGCKR